MSFWLGTMAASFEYQGDLEDYERWLADRAKTTPRRLSDSLLPQRVPRTRQSNGESADDRKVRQARRGGLCARKSARSAKQQALTEKQMDSMQAALAGRWTPS